MRNLPRRKGVLPLCPPTFRLPKKNAINPIEALEAQAQRQRDGRRKIQSFSTNGERRSFGDGPLMPEYFDEAMAALDPPIPVEMGMMEEDIDARHAARRRNFESVSH